MGLRSFLAFVVWIVLLGLTASAQTPAPHPDVPMTRAGGVYPIGCHTPLDTDLEQACWARTDLPEGVVELGCVEAPDPDTRYGIDVTVDRTPHVNAVIKCYVTDSEGLISEYSDNSGMINFMPPGKPRVVAKHVASWQLTWPQSRQRKRLLLEIEEPDEIVLWTPRPRHPAQVKTLVLMIEDR